MTNGSRRGGVSALAIAAPGLGGAAAAATPGDVAFQGDFAREMASHAMGVAVLLAIVAASVVWARRRRWVRLRVLKRRRRRLGRARCNRRQGGEQERASL